MRRYEYCDNPVEEILEDLHDGFRHGSRMQKLVTRPMILLLSVVIATLTALACGYGSAQCIVACLQQMPPVGELSWFLSIPISLFAAGTPIGVAIVSFSITRQHTYTTLRWRCGDSCDHRVIIPVRILNDLLL